MRNEPPPGVDTEVLIELWGTISSIVQSLAELGRWDGVIANEGGLDPRVYQRFLIDFDVTRKLLDSRQVLDGLLAGIVGDDWLEDLASGLPEWRYRPEEDLYPPPTSA